MFYRLYVSVKIRSEEAANLPTSETNNLFKLLITSIQNYEKKEIEKDPFG